MIRPEGERPLCRDTDNDQRHSQHRLRRWFWVNTVLSGAFAMLWLLLRSGGKPSRLAYPCQQAAMGTATAAFGVPLVAALLSMRHQVAAALTRRAGKLCALGLVAGAVSVAAWAGGPRPVPAYKAVPPAQPRESYQAQVFVMDNAGGPVGQRFEGLEDLILWMGLNGKPFYQSAVTRNFETGPGGIIAVKDVVVIKINYQWDERGGTNTDLLRGLVRRIVDHPDAFVGQIVVCENAQFVSTSGFDRLNNNAEVHALSPHDVVVEFQGLGFNISHFDWTNIRGTSVSEYSAGNMTDGYVVYPYDSGILGRVSYPKFQSDAGTYISLKLGVWNNIAGTYDRGRLKFINVPVLKSHSATYGATACVKNYMGVVTGLLSTNSHSAIGYGLLGALLGEIGLADLNILDCIWINANPYDGPWTSYGAATRVDKLVASVDPVAADLWADKNILIPTFIGNGYTPPWPNPSADPDNPGSAFRVYLDNSMNRILSAGFDVTNDPARITALRWDGTRGMTGDLNDDGRIDGDDIQIFVDVTLGVQADPLQTLRADMDADLDVDMDDASLFVSALTGA